MPARPRRSAATKAKETISVHARWADSGDKALSQPATMSSRRSNRVVRDDDSADDSHADSTVHVASGRSRAGTRGSTRRSDAFEGGEIVHGKRDRGGKKKYVVDSSPDDDDEEEEEPQLDDDDEDDDMDDGEEDAEGEDEMEVDAEGEEDEDAEGDVEMDVPPSSNSGPTIKISRSGASKPTRAAASRVVQEEDDDDDDELSDPESDVGDQTLGLGDDDDAEDDGEDDDAEGEDIEIGGEGQEAGSDEEFGSQDEEPDLTKMTKRQRARFEDDTPQDFMKLSDEVQAKKVFTAEELSMRRQEMARRRRNLSEKRNEEVKMETINKLLKKQAPKVNKKAAAAAAAADATPEDDSSRINPVFVRWTSNKSGSRVAVPEDMVDGPAGKVFQKGMAPGKMVEEVA